MKKVFKDSLGDLLVNIDLTNIKGYKTKTTALK